MNIANPPIAQDASTRTVLDKFDATSIGKPQKILLHQSCHSNENKILERRMLSKTDQQLIEKLTKSMTALTKEIQSLINQLKK